MAGNEASFLAALAGPPKSTTAGEGISDTVLVYSPSKSTPDRITLPANAANLNPGQAGQLNAILAETPPRQVQINVATGEITEPQGNGNNLFGNFNVASVDLGDGVKEIVSQNIPANQLGLQFLVAVDNVDKPTKAKLGALDAEGAVQFSVDFPTGWLPLLAPPAPAGPGGAPGVGGPGGGGAALLNRLRSTVTFDATTRAIFVIGRATDSSSDSMVRFAVTATTATATVASLPKGQFVASCTNQIRLFTIELSRRLAIATSNEPETTVKNPCSGFGFALYDIDQPAFEMVPLPGQGQFNATGAGSNEMNDYVYGTNTDPARQGRSDTLYVVDAVTSAAFRLDLPAEIGSFSNLVPFPAMGLLVGLGNTNAARVNGDAGLVVFDLENAESRILPVPAGFSSVQFLSVLNASRNVLARGIRADGPGTQLLIYDLVTRDLQIIPNPADCNFVAQGPATPAQPGTPQQQPITLQFFGPRSGNLMIGCFNAQRQAVSILSIKVN